MYLYIISGVAGMTGNELARQLLKNGHKVIGFDNFFASSLDAIKDLLVYDTFLFYEFDINVLYQMNELKRKIKAVQVNCEKLIYINCAAVVHTEHFYFVNRTFSTNVTSMKFFLDQSIEMSADIFINCSTSEVYSMNSWCEEGVREDNFLTLANAEHSQRTSYAVGKLMTEFFMRDAVECGNIHGCSIRFANVYSRNELYPKHIIPHIIISLIKNGSVELLENSRQNYRTFLHNYDSCASIISLMNTDSALDGTVYNVGTDEEISIIDLVGLCARKLGIGNPSIEFKNYRASDPVRRLLNTEKIRARTGWSPKISLEKGIELCISGLKL